MLYVLYSFKICLPLKALNNYLDENQRVEFYYVYYVIHCLTQDAMISDNNS